ncbi:TonB-dependent receptor plug domain-containing protein [Sphingomicrobium arenosum]|uniref:TonB-dependent receptor plug domain-containing protein n=1 Tax=Sphingomicrobium arenosum TaxID=2233861 RepID=UPI002240F294|nr:TonB-dependent receptor plug domain-containing protein [Sphingomicrobium arenosum]
MVSQLAISIASLLLMQDAAAQEAGATVPEDDSDPIIVTGTAPRGSVLGDVEPILTLDARDVRATGATSVSELLEVLAPELGSTRGRGGGRPIILVDGRRISGWREMRDLPTEAIERVEVLPEEVALSYGYRADQRVVNFVLRENFYSTTIETEVRFPTSGGRMGGEFEVGRLMLSPGKRTSVDVQYERDGLLTEDERDIALDPVETVDGPIDPRPFRSLVGATETLQITGVAKRPLGEASATATAGFEETNVKSLLGPLVATLDVPADSPFADGEAVRVVRDAQAGALTRNRRSRGGSFEFAVNSAPGDWRWSTTGSLELSETRTRTDEGADVGVLQAGLDALSPGFDPFGVLLFDTLLPRSEARSRTLRAEVDAQLSGIVMETAAGESATTLTARATHLGIHSEERIETLLSETTLERQRLAATASLDVPLLDASAVGDLSLNLNAEVEELSDFGLLTLYGAGVNFKPTRRLDLIVSVTVEEGAPSLSQLGDPRITDPAARVLDLVTGETVLAAVTTGGNPALLADRRTVWKLGAGYDISMKDEDWSLDLRADFTSSRISDPIQGFPELTPAIEAAFPERVTRDGDGRLVALDITPINVAEERRDTLRWGLNFRKRLEPNPPSEATMARFRERMRGMRGRGSGGGERPAAAGGEGPPAPRQGQQSQQGGQMQQASGGGEQAAGGEQQARRGRGGGGGPMGRFGSSRGPHGGRLYGSITHEVNFTDERLIDEDGPLLDYLDGASLGRFGGRSRHKVESRFGLFNNGFGARVSVDWYGPTRVDTGVGELRYDDYGTVDLRLYANLGERMDLLSRHPWLRGSSVRIGIDNLLDERPRVTDETGAVPLAYQPALLRPEGRTFAIEFRKLFIPRQFMREEMRRRRDGGA